jgi:hypothetical protein
VSILDLKFLMTLSIFLHVISNFSFHTLTILLAEVWKEYLQYFQNTILGSIVRVLRILLKYFQDTIRNSIEPCTQWKKI